MKRILFLAAAVLALLCTASCARYESVKGDPMATRIYTLPNGLKVYMTVNKDEPRIQTYIAVRSGGKNDPADNTGLAHYLEHMMFKGTEQFGTSDFAAEKPMLATIDSLFEVYRTLTDTTERLALYHQIDSVSYEASKIAIPNEYDTLMALIGSNGSNAYTSNDVTCYMEEIPSNQIENWAKIEADHFKNCVFRGFHTELEAVYEEKNISLNNDTEKALEAIDALLFTHHPYGSQTVIGTQDHLKNPSLMAIRRQKDTYYVPNNVAICLSGDFDPEEMIGIIRKYFGDWKPNPALPKFSCEPEEPITAPKVRDVYGNESEFLLLGWRTPGENSRESEIGQIVSSILSNGMAGLLDLNVNNRQEALYTSAFSYDRSDYGILMAEGLPKQGQTLEQVTEIILREVARLREGNFDESLIQATVNNFKLSEMQSLENNSSRAGRYVDAFINGVPWSDVVTRLDRMERLTKDDIVAWAQKYLGPDSYAVVYKRIGEDPDIKKIVAPAITPIMTNRELQSDFVASIQASEVKPIEPVFVNYDRDMSRTQAGPLELLYKQNVRNDIAQLVFRFNTGSAIDPALGLASNYLEYLGTADKSHDEIMMELYDLACETNVSVGSYNTTVVVSGLSENIAKALDLAEDLLLNAVGDDDILEALKADEIKSRADNKMNQRSCYSAVQRYLFFGPEYIRKTTLTNKELLALSSEELLEALKGLYRFDHTVLYYGPASEEEVKTLLAEHHRSAAEPVALPEQFATYQQTPTARVILAPYPSRQFNYMQYSNRGEQLDPSAYPAIRLFNEYFGGGMNTIVFQEMRESRALAYSAGAYLANPSWAGGNYYFRATIGSQNDKLQQAVEAFDLIINDMPQSDKNFEIARTAIESDVRTRRYNGIDVLYSFLNTRQLGLSEPSDRAIFEQIGSMTMDDLVACQQRWVKGRTYVYGILGDPGDLDMNYLKTLGPVQRVSLEEVFGY